MLSNLVKTALRSENLGQAVAIARKSLGSKKPMFADANDLVQTAQMLASAGAENDALKIWAKAASVSRKDFKSLRGLARHLLKHNKTKEALPLLRSLCEMEESTPSDLWTYSRAQRKLGIPSSETLETSIRLTEIDENNAGAWYTLARDQHKLGMLDKALASYQKVLGRAPTSYKYLQYYALCLVEHGDPRQALSLAWPLSASMEERIAILWPVARGLRKAGYRTEAYEALQRLASVAGGKQLAAVDSELSELRRDWRASLKKPDDPSLTFDNVVETNRLLVVIDLAIMPYSVGELFYMFEAALCYQLEQGLDKFDIAFIADTKQPARGDQQTNSYNYFEKLNALTQTTAFPRSLDSYFVFGDRTQFEKFLSENINRYAIWPPLEDYYDRTFGYQNNVPYINEFFERNNFIPFLEPRTSLVDRMRKFLIEESDGAVPIVVHLRLNKLHRDSRRNSNIPSWKSFFRRCASENMNVKFFVVTGTTEFFEPEVQGLGDLNNVVLVKKHNTNVNEDFTLCMVGAAFLGGPSGPSVAVMYSDRPYVFFNYKKETTFHFVGTGPGQNYQFAQKNQILVWERENDELLYSEFKKIFSEIDTEQYFKELNSKPRAKNLGSMHVLK